MLSRPTLLFKVHKQRQFCFNPFNCFGAPFPCKTLKLGAHSLITSGIQFHQRLRSQDHLILWNMYLRFGPILWLEGSWCGQFTTASRIFTLHHRNGCFTVPSTGDGHEQLFVGQLGVIYQLSHLGAPMMHEGMNVDQPSG